MYIIKKLVNEVFEIPYVEGYRNLQILAGYVSPAFVEYILDEYKNLTLDIVVGMVSHEGISSAHHHAFKRIVEKYSGRAVISYQTVKPGNHRKIYYWLENEFLGLPPKIFVGSANFSYNGFIKQKELLVEATFNNIEEVFEDLHVMPCNHLLIEENVLLYKLVVSKRDKQIKPSKKVLPEKLIKIDSTNKMDFVDVSLLSEGKVPARSGLNWGQREGRNKNQAYLSVLKKVHEMDPFFFPQIAEPFTMLTDDGESLVCVMAQANRKGIHTRESNSIMGAYFRKRLGLADGEFVKTQHVLDYGRTSVRIYKIDDETYYMDFSLEKE